jgi:hypothetical protein
VMTPLDMNPFLADVRLCLRVTAVVADRVSVTKHLVRCAGELSCDKVRVEQSR